QPINKTRNIHGKLPKRKRQEKGLVANWQRVYESWSPRRPRLSESEIEEPEEKEGQMDFENIKKYLDGNASGQVDVKNRSAVGAMPYRFFERFNVQGLHVELVEPGRIICSIKVPPSLLNAGKSLHGGAIATLVDVVGSAVIYTVSAPQNTGVSVEINVSYLDSAYVNVSIIYSF
ncbi:unnamed protein product, partial [Linum tenue]